MSFAIVILNHKSSHLLNNLLEHIMCQCGVRAGQVYVVDNSLDSQERINLAALKRYYKFNYLILDNNRGYSAGNNVGIDKAINDGFSYIYVVNPDVIPNKDVFIRMYRKYASRYVGFCVGPRVYNPFIRLDENPLRKPNFFLGLFGVSSVYKGEGVLLAGSFLFFDKVYWSKVGGFPEEVFMYNEEIILHHKAITNSLSTLYDPAFEVCHNHEKSFKGLDRELNRKKSQLSSAKHVMKKYLNYSESEILLYAVLFWIRSVVMLAYKIVRYGRI